ncbi:MAG TPA: hypothetical protein VG204_04450 [Terriglobia bacterium]|nr:hypothetical protein [Terriglobia bacterium]
MSYTAIHSEGGLIPEDILDQIAREEMPGQKAADFGFAKGTRLGDEIARAWSDAQDYFRIFGRHAQDLPDGETGASLTRERWMVPLLNHLLGYEVTYQTAGAVVSGQTFPISHRAGPGTDWPPVHLAGFREELDRRPPTGHRRLSPQALVQEYLNRTEEYLWGVVSNGQLLRLLRQTTRTSRPSYLEFDLRGILDGQLYNEFTLFFRLCHRTRLPHPAEDPHRCLLEDYFQKSIEQGGRVRDRLRGGVEKALRILGSGFLAHPQNVSLREKIQAGKLTAAEFHRQLLRLVYRLLFLMVAEERKMISSEGPEADRQRRLYQEYYSVARLRNLAEHVLEESPYGDLWLGLKQTVQLFSDVPGSNPLGIPPLNGELFSSGATRDLNDTHLLNQDLVRAIRHLSLFEHEKVRRRINYAALDVEELGSVYESLLDLEPVIQTTPEGFAFDFRAGTTRKSTGSYYTRPELVAELIQSALVPVLEERVKAATTPEEKERAILSMKVCDPASGSGHFLLAAARRMGRELAKARTGEEEPTPQEFHLAVRDVIAHCLYAVDKNPLAVDLCKVALWLEGHWTGKPLSFLDHRVKCGDSLVGVLDPAVLKQGIPDEAFNPVTGDDKKAASAFKKRNRKERESPTRHLPFAETPLGRLEEMAQQYAALGEVAEDQPADVKRKADLYRQVHDSVPSHQAHRAANLWTAAFFAPLKQAGDPMVPTSEALADYLERPNAPYGPMIGLADSLAGESKHNFFHWFLEFPEVFAQGGFDVVLGNPPWERIKLEEQEFFATRDLAIAEAPNKAARQKLIDQLSATNPALAREFEEQKHDAEAGSKLVRASGRYPLTAVGDVNTYALFADLSRQLVNRRGSVGILLPTGIATDDTTKAFFSEVAEKQSLARLIGFENEAFIFPAVHHSFKFCAFTLRGEQTKTEQADFAFFCRHFEDVRDQRRHFKLTRDDFRLLNPNTLTCPVFRTQADAELTKRIYHRVPVLVNERTGRNPWGIHFTAMFHMSNDSRLFESARKDGLVSLYEAKMVYHFDHRYGTFEGATQAQLNVGSLPQPSADQKQDPSLCARPRYWVSKADLNARLERWNREESEPIWRWERNWLVAFRDVTSAVVERTAIFSLLPRVGVGNNATLAILDKDSATVTFVCCFLGNLNSLTFDYVTRQKIAGSHMNFFFVNQLPVLAPDGYLPADIEFIAPRVLELVYTAWDIKSFADDLWRDSDDSLKDMTHRQWDENKAITGGHEFSPPEWAEIAEDGIPLPPFKWDEGRRAQIRADLDAYYALLYGLTRDELRYILDPKDVCGPDFPGETFRVLKEKEEKLYGEHRTRRLVLEAYDRLAPGFTPRKSDQVRAAVEKR